MKLENGISSWRLHTYRLVWNAEIIEGDPSPDRSALGFGTTPTIIDIRSRRDG